MLPPLVTDPNRNGESPSLVDLNSPKLRDSCVYPRGSEAEEPVLPISGTTLSKLPSVLHGYFYGSGVAGFRFFFCKQCFVTTNREADVG